ncbi:MAG: acetoacetate--CoA ligase, partial [Actinomycetota bacterium]|nr:acetoacetate--CoA ligase [Actinomycetota bacterium]
MSAGPGAEAPLWVPSPARRADANLTRYTRWLAEHRGVALPEYDYQALWQWSVDNLEDFYASLWDYFAIDSDDGYSRVLGDAAMPGARWFPCARLNYAEHVFRGRADDALAVQFASEGSPPRSWTWGELRARTAA